MAILTTAIRTVTTGQTSTAAAVYTLDGRRITPSTESLPKGIYIVGGKKYISK